MQLEIVSVYDVKADIFSTPVFTASQATAKRDFADVAQNPESKICKHPEDYRLFLLGMFDDETGTVESVLRPVLLISALEAINPDKNHKEKHPEIPIRLENGDLALEPK